MNVQFAHISGGRYTARQNEDGTWDVLDVPIFTLVEKGVKNSPRDISEDDLRLCVREHQRKSREDGFLARTNILHNRGLHKSTPAGFLLPRVVKPFRMNRQTKPVIFADILNMPDVLFGKLTENEFPYCSVEVRTYEPLILGALALLDTEPPFFEFPLLTIGDREGYASLVTDPEAVAVACFQFREDPEEEPMPEDTLPGKKKDDEEEAQLAEGGEMDVGAAIKALQESMKMLEPLIALKDQIAALIEGGGEEEEVVTDDVVDQPVAAMSHEDAKLAGRVAGLEEYRDTVENEKSVLALFDAEIKELEADGFNLTDKTRVTFRKFAEQGAEALKMFSSSFRENAVQDPPAELLGIPSGQTAWPAEVMHFSSESPEKFADAKTAYRDWSQFPDDKNRSTLENYLKREVI